MKTITSPENEAYKSFSRLYKKKYRERTGMYIAEGENLITEAKKNSITIRSLYVREDFADSDMVDDVQEMYPDAELYCITRQLFDRAADTETPQGIAAVCDIPHYTTDDFFRDTGNVVVLDRLQDPGNLGTIIRTADACGFRGLVVMKGTADLFSPKTVRAAAGSLYRVRLLYIDEAREACEILATHGKRVVCTSPYASEIYFDADIAEDVALVIGNEAGGACEDFINFSDINVKLPMEGNIESLNAGVAGSVVMYESLRQRYIKHRKDGGK